ncbi:MAG: hypothetical protein HGB10_00620 [Coriobacteriia bacterium]|nr:hypothetical protein [Coriobacteriia bacterium]
MNHAVRRYGILLCAILVIAAFAVTPAYGNLDSEPAQGIHGTTSTNPSAGPDYWWRQGWGRSLNPDFMLNPPEGMDWTTEGWIAGILYSVDRTDEGDVTGVTGEAVIDPTTPDEYYTGWMGISTPNTGPYGTDVDYTLDMRTIAESRSESVEGRWYYHYRFMSSRTVQPFSDRVHQIDFGIDTVPPRPVENLHLYSWPTSSEVTTWQASSRMWAKWTPDSHDDRAGVGYYAVLIDGKPFLPEAEEEPARGRAYVISGWPNPSSITIESMPPGKHLVSIVAVDRATNESTVTSAYFYSDPDTPTIEFTSPVTNFLNSRTLVSVDASDAAGDPLVTFAFDSVPATTLAAPPYNFKPDLTTVTAGDHVITATVTDHLNRSVTVTKTVSTLGTTSSGFQYDDSGALDALHAYTSTTNPAEKPTLAWGNSVWPQFSIQAPSGPDIGNTTGLLYRVDKSEDTTLNIAGSDYFRSTHSSGVDLEEQIDLLGVLAYPPVGGWPTPFANETSVLEGQWYLHYIFYTDDGYAGTQTQSIPFGIDVTPPRAVSGLKSSPTTDMAYNGSWTAASRAHVTWTPGVYDDLSGVNYYQYRIDGVIPTTGGLGRVVEVEGRTPFSFTVENMPAGAHRISVAAVDRAGNEGPSTVTTFFSDPDVPTISFGSFSRTISTTPKFTVNVADEGGIDRVVYALDAVAIGTNWASPYDLWPNLSTFTAGTHTLTATVYDKYQRSATATTTVTLDKTPVTVSGFSRTPELFYPILRDGYKDNATISYKTNKPCTAVLTIKKQSTGATVRTITSSVGAGSHKFIWNGKWTSDGKAHIGTYTYRIKVTDSVGSTASTGSLSTRIRNYQLVRVSSSKVKVIPR